MTDRKLTTLFTAALLFVIGALALPPTAALGQEIPKTPEGAWMLPAIPEEAATADLDAVMPVDPNIIIGELDNGLHYYIRENSYPENRADLRLVVKVGSLVEDNDQLGLAHFVEHMAFNGTERFEKQALVKALESFGMRFGPEVNASTSFDETVYMLRIPTDEEEIMATAFWILEDWAQGVAFEDEEIDKERGVVIEEWRLGLGVGSRVNDQQLPLLFQGSRYTERLPIGTLESLQTFDHEALRRFYRDWYRPDLMAIIAVGDFDKKDIQRRIIEHFGEMENPEIERPREFFDTPEHEETLFGIVEDPESPGSTVAVFHKLPIRPQGTHGTYRQKIVENLYNSMFNRRLSEVAHQPNPPFLGASSSQGIFIPTREVYVIGAAVPDGGIERGLKALYTEAERVDRYGFTKTELEREKAQVLRAFERIYTEKNLQDSGTFADEFERAFLEGESVPGIDYEWALYQRFIPEITLEEVNRVGRQWLTDENRVIFVTAPEKDGLSLPEKEELLAVLDEVGSEWVPPYFDTTTTEPLLADLPEPGTIVEEKKIEELDVTEWRLSNGVRVVMKPTDLREDQVLLRAFSPGGTSLASDEDYIAALSSVQVVASSGFGGFSPRQITNMLADKVVEVNPTIGELEEGFAGGASPRDLETMFQLIYLKFTAPQADPGIFQLLTQQIRESLANSYVTPEEKFQREVQKTLTQEHFRRRPISVEIIDEMDLQKSYDFYVDRFADASDFTFVFVGNFTVDQMRPLVEQYLGGLPSTGREETWRDEGVDPPTGVIKKAVFAGVEPKSLTGIIFSGTPPAQEVGDGGAEAAGEEGGTAGEVGNEGVPASRAMSAMGSILQIRLREVMREALSGVYTVQVDESLSRIPDEEYSVSIFFGSDPDRVQELTGVIFDEIEKLKTEGPTEQEVANIREQMRRGRETALKRNGFWLNQLVGAYRDGEDPRQTLDYEAELAKITPAVIQEAAQAYFDTGNYVQISLFPEEMQER
jgi:zinc protease